MNGITPVPNRTLMLGPPYPFFGSNVPASAATSQRFARASATGMSIANELFTGFHSNTVIAAVVSTFQLRALDSAVRVTVTCPVVGLLGFAAFGIASVECNFHSALTDPAGARTFRVGSGGSAVGGVSPLPLVAHPVWQGPLVTTTVVYTLNLPFVGPSAPPRLAFVNCTLEGTVLVAGFAHAFLRASMVPTFGIEIWRGFSFPP